MSTPPEEHKQLVLAEIRKLARERGSAPGITAFISATGLQKHRFIGVHWARWSDALKDAGFPPNDKQERFDIEEMLGKAAAISLSIGHVPTKPEMKMLRSQGADLPHPDIFTRRFGSFASFRAALREYCANREHLTDVAAMIAEEEVASNTQSSARGHVYLLRSGSNYKIGRTEKLERRIREITIALPEAVVLEHTISTDDPTGIEAYWHRRFADRRLNGEWFKLSRADVAAFRRRKFQ